MKKLTIIIILLSCFCSMSHAQNKSTQFKHGKLPNGLTYYIQQTTQNPGAADFYLVQNVGALMENADQNGLAHVLEHMAFHATTSFPEDMESIPLMQIRGMTKRYTISTTFLSQHKRSLIHVS